MALNFGNVLVTLDATGKIISQTTFTDLAIFSIEWLPIMNLILVGGTSTTNQTQGFFTLFDSKLNKTSPINLYRTYDFAVTKDGSLAYQLSK